MTLRESVRRVLYNVLSLVGGFLWAVMIEYVLVKGGVPDTNHAGTVLFALHGVIGWPEEVFHNEFFRLGYWLTIALQTCWVLFFLA
jgi:hypothetical protein